MTDIERKLFESHRDLVEQIESGNGRDDYGHPIGNLKELGDARAIADGVEGTFEDAGAPFALPRGQSLL